MVGFGRDSSGRKDSFGLFFCYPFYVISSNLTNPPTDGRVTCFIIVSEYFLRHLGPRILKPKTETGRIESGTIQGTGETRSKE